MLPAPLKSPLQEHLRNTKVIYERDLADGWGRVQMPDALDRKYPKAPRGLALAMGLSPGAPMEEHADG
jgi:hypothetical protein